MSDTTLIQHLQNVALYNHPVIQFELIETHLSWVILTGLYAYKIKKPLNLGFNDFTSLDKRRHYCELELQLNALLAPDLYLNMVAISGSDRAPLLYDLPNETPIAPIIEYAVKTKQFDQKNLLSQIYKKNKIHYNIIDSIAKQCAVFHQKIPQCEASQPYGTPEMILHPIEDNFNTIEHGISLAPELKNWVAVQYHYLKPLFEKRKKNGFIRACHGDIHLNNIVLINNQAVIFDCIEFNEAFRWIDVMNDIAFFAMDLERIHQPDLAHYFVNRYCEYTGDYEGLLLLKFYKAYRALVRAKIAFLMNDKKQAQLFIDLTNRYIQDPSSTLSITFGPSGTGKSHYTEHLMQIRLRSDVIRKQLMKLPAHQSASPVEFENLYSEAMTHRLYYYLRDVAKILLHHSISVIIDAAFLKKWQRDLFYELAHSLRVPFTIFEFDIQPDILKQQIIERAKDADQSSDATALTLDKQLQILEPLSTLEKSFSKKVTS